MVNVKENSKAAFNRQAATYDNDIKGQHARSLYPVLLKKLSEIPCHTVLDLGCGTGEMIKLILEQNKDKSLYGLDLSEKMLEVAKQKLGNNTNLILGDSERLPFINSFFDVVYCNDSFHHYPAPDKVLSEVRRVLKPSGTFIMCDCWQPAIGRVIMNFYMKHGKEGDVKIYSENEIRELFSHYFSKTSWQLIGNTSCMACGVKQLIGVIDIQSLTL